MAIVFVLYASKNDSCYIKYLIIVRASTLNVKKKLGKAQNTLNWVSHMNAIR
mgnify:CR=1 FL=1